MVKTFMELADDQVLKILYILTYSSLKDMIKHFLENFLFWVRFGSVLGPFSGYHTLCYLNGGLSL